MKGGETVEVQLLKLQIGFINYRDKDGRYSLNHHCEGEPQSIKHEEIHRQDNAL